MKFVRTSLVALATENNLVLAAMQDNDLESAITHQRRVIEMTEAMGSTEVVPHIVALADQLEFADENQASIAAYTRAIDLAASPAVGDDERAEIGRASCRERVFLAG